MSKDEPQKVSNKLLIIGLLLSIAGVIGIVGLRLGLIQNYLFGDPHPYPGIGYVEPSGHIVSSIPLVIGLVIVLFWGIKYDPIYKEIEKLKEEESEGSDDDSDEGPFDFELSDDELDEPEENEAEGPFEWETPDEEEELESISDLELPPIVLPKPQPAKTAQPSQVRAQPPQKAVVPLPKEASPVAKKPIVPPAAKAPEPIQATKKLPVQTTAGVQAQVTATSKPPVRTTVKVPVPAPAAKPGPASVQTTPRDEQAEKIRVERCLKMLSFAAIIPEDRESLVKLIDEGISTHAFTAEVKKSVEKRKMIDSEAAEKKKAEESASKMKAEEEEKALLEDTENPENDDYIDDEELEDLLLSEIDK